MFKKLIEKISKLNTENFVVMVIVLVMLNNVEHLAFVHHSMSRLLFPTYEMNWWHSILVVLIIEVSIIVLVNKGQQTFALVYAMCIFVLSLIYYPLDVYWKNGQYGLFAAAIIYSFMFTISIYYFACMRAEKSWENSQLRERNKRLDTLAVEMQQLTKRLLQSDASLKQKENELMQITATLQQNEANLQQSNVRLNAIASELERKDNELQQLRKYRQQIEAACVCESCGEAFKSEASKRSHAGKCKGKSNLEKAA
jgi:hypothetical protein